MKLKDLITENKINPDDAESVCEYLTACKIPYKKIFNDDFTGADFVLDDLETATKAFKELIAHRNISVDFNLNLDTSNNTISAKFKDPEEYE